MRVGEVAQAAGVSVRSIHHYESVGLLRPSRTGNGYRRFSADDVKRVEVIRRFQGVGFSLIEIRELAPCWRDDVPIDARPASEMGELYSLKLTEIEAQIRQLTIVRDELVRRLEESKQPCS